MDSIANAIADAESFVLSQCVPDKMSRKDAVRYLNEVMAIIEAEIDEIEDGSES